MFVIKKRSSFRGAFLFNFHLALDLVFPFPATAIGATVTRKYNMAPLAKVHFAPRFASMGR